MTADDIMRAVWLRMRSGAAVAMPRYTPTGWWECDLAIVTKAGYFTEVEIKTTAADIVRDADKARVRYAGMTKVVRRKHAELQDALRIGPSRYFMAVPWELRAHPAIPKFAGVWAVEERGGRKIAKLVRRAPRLHEHRPSPGLGEMMRLAAFHRYVNAIGLTVYDDPSATKHSHEPRTALWKRLIERRNRAVVAGMPLLNWSGLDHELKSRRARELPGDDA